MSEAQHLSQFRDPHPPQDEALTGASFQAFDIKRTLAVAAAAITLASPLALSQEARSQDPTPTPTAEPGEPTPTPTATPTPEATPEPTPTPTPTPTPETTPAPEPPVITPEQPSAPPAPEVVTPPSNPLVDRIDQIIEKTALAWANRQTPEGRFIDPVLNKVPSYGGPMIGQALIEVGLRHNNPELIRKGINALLYQIQYPDSDGFNAGFEAFGMGNSYYENQTKLANNPDWQVAAPKIAAFLESRAHLPVGESVKYCFTNPRCWSNLKLVKAYATISLQQANIATADPLAAARAARLTSETSSLLAQATKNSSRNARFYGDDLSLGEAGILSDPDKNPLAYNALSAMLLGQIIERVGKDNVPAAVMKTLERSAKAIVGMMAPDGDVTYIGRGQGQVWTPAAAASALAVAAKYTGDPELQKRYIEATELSIERLEKQYEPNVFGMPIVPHQMHSTKPSYLGVDSYANYGYNGLALELLSDARQALLEMTPVVSASISNKRAHRKGVFVDPSQTEFATIQDEDHWLAIHGDTSHPKDARYGFGLVAAMVKKANGDWTYAVQPNPKTDKLTSGGPVLTPKGSKQQLIPVGDRVKATRKGKVTVPGGWARTPGGRKAAKTTFVFNGKKGGVELGFKVPKSGNLAFRIWYEAGSKITKNRRGFTIKSPDGAVQTRQFNLPVRIQRANGKFHSAYEKNMRAIDVTTGTVKSGKAVKQKIRLR